MSLRMSTYCIQKDLLEQILEVLSDHMFFQADDDEYNDDDVCKVVMLLRDEIEKQEHMAEAAGVKLA